MAPVGPSSHSGDGADGGDTGRLHDFIARVRALRHRDELDKATIAALSALESSGVQAVVLKGPALVQRLYAEGEARGYSDVDLLVRRSNLAAAGESLKNLGYVRIPMFGIVDVAGVQHSEVWGRESPRGGPLQIDLHWRLDGCEAPGDLIWEALAARRRSVELRGKQVPVLADDGLALHLALHAAQHGPNDSKAIGDLARGIERWPPEVWCRAGQLAERVQGVAALAAGLRLLPDGATIASELGLPPTPEQEWKIHHRDIRPRGTFHLQAITEARGAKERANVLRRSLFPTPRWIRYEYAWAARGRTLLVLAYARHILRAPLWAARAARFLASARRAGKRG